MNELEWQIARFLAQKASGRSRTTYQQVGEKIGWPHPTGRGLGDHLYEILHYCKEQGLPPLTTILVKKGEKVPAADAMYYIRSALGDLDIPVAQQAVFDFDWSTVPGFVDPNEEHERGQAMWLTSFWGFDPANWGCIGFAEEWRRNKFLSQSRDGALVAIYVTRGKGPVNMRGKVVGILQLSHEVGPAKNFISGDAWARKQNDPESKDKWMYAVRATRAWRVVEEEWKDVDKIFSETYGSNNPELIGAQGVKLTKGEAEALGHLSVYEVPVYGQTGRTNSSLGSLESALSPSRAVPPATEPYWVGEVDGPKHLYILELTGDIATYLRRAPADVERKKIIKVGFSKSPTSRRDQIQAAYPAGQYKWEIALTGDLESAPPYPCAEVAIIGEDAMKRRLVEEGAESLGREFYLAEDWLVHKTWSAGKFAADEYLRVNDFATGVSEG